MVPQKMQAPAACKWRIQFFTYTLVASFISIKHTRIITVCRGLTTAAQAVLSQGFLVPPQALSVSSAVFTQQWDHKLTAKGAAFCSVFAENVQVTTAVGIINTNGITHTRKHPCGKFSHRVNTKILLVT